MQPDDGGRAALGDDRRDVCAVCREPLTRCRCDELAAVTAGLAPLERRGLTTSASIAQLGAALAKAQGLMDNAAKDSKNPHFNSRYADLASVVAACRAALANVDIAVVQNPSTHDGNLVRMSTLLLHASGEWLLSDTLQVQAKDAGPQSIGSCLTYLRRYQLAAIVGVAPADDDDAEAAEGRKPPPPILDKPYTPKPPPPKPPYQPPSKPQPVPQPAAKRRDDEPPPLTDKDPFLSEVL